MRNQRSENSDIRWENPLPSLPPHSDSRDRFSVPEPSDWLLFPWKLLCAYSKPPSPSSRTKTPLPSPKLTLPSPPTPQQQQHRGVKSGEFWAGGCLGVGEGKGASVWRSSPAYREGQGVKRPAATGQSGGRHGAVLFRATQSSVLEHSHASKPQLPGASLQCLGGESLAAS